MPGKTGKLLYHEIFGRRETESFELRSQISIRPVMKNFRKVMNNRRSVVDRLLNQSSEAITNGIGQ
jgi:hypothetical protein